MLHIFARLIFNKRKQFFAGNDAVHKAFVLTFNKVVVAIESSITVRLLSQCISLNISLKFFDT